MRLLRKKPLSSETIEAFIIATAEKRYHSVMNRLLKHMKRKINGKNNNQPT
jgi:hypothetical protein